MYTNHLGVEQGVRGAGLELANGVARFTTFREVAHVAEQSTQTDGRHQSDRPGVASQAFPSNHSASPPTSFHSQHTPQPACRGPWCEYGDHGNNFDCHFFRELLREHAARAAAETASPSSSRLSSVAEQSSFESVAPTKKIAIERLEHAPNGPDRKSTARICGIDGCKEVLARTYDLYRHRRQIHGTTETIWKCDEPTCGRIRPRNDKMRDHCKKSHHRGPSKVHVGGGQNAEQHMAMLEQQGEKRARRNARRDHLLSPPTWTGRPAPPRPAEH